jgi:hypothetical protein
MAPMKGEGWWVRLLDWGTEGARKLVGGEPDRRLADGGLSELDFPGRAEVMIEHVPGRDRPFEPPKKQTSRH